MESAISQIDIGDVPVITRYRPWLLRPNLARDPTKYVDKRESYIKMFKGDVGRFNAMVKRITDIGLEDDVNIAFKYEGDIGTTINCSQLIMWAETYGLQQHYDLKEAIMSAYHEQAKNIALTEVMLDCVRQVDGLKEHVEEAEMVLQTDGFKKAVADQIIDAQKKLNVNGVPHFFITAVNGDVARSFNFPGAQDTRFFTNALSKLNAIVHETDASKL